MNLEFEQRVRQAAFAFLADKVAVHGEVLTLPVLREGFVVDGDRLAVAVFQRGIFKPRLLDAALSILTAPPRATAAPYDDHVGADGLYRYHYRGTDPQEPDNQAVRRAMVNRLPLIYFHGVTPGQYLPIWPVYVVSEDPVGGYFHVDLTGSLPVDIGVASDPPDRRYRTGLVLHRLHQAAFRQRVLHAYKSSCSMCRLKRPELVDAAHIVTDAEGGAPDVPNGLALCKLHHAAFDRHILGVRPDLRIVVRQDILEEVDGPMLIHGLQDFHNAPLVVPRPPTLQPGRENLERRYEVFLRAS